MIDFFRRQPALLKIVKDTLNASNEYLTQAFMHGAKYAEDHLQREKDVFEEDQAVEGGSVGLAQADYQQYAEQHGEEIEKKYQIEAKIAPEYEKYLQNLDKQMEEKKTELKKQIEKENDPLKKSELQAQLKALNQPEFEESLKGLKDPIKRAEQIKKIRIDFVGALFQHYTFNDGTHSNSLGVGINVTFDRFNTRLGNNIKIFDKFSLSGGVGVAQYEKARSPIVGLAATLSNQVDLWK
ncbi:MAG: hypothetical protein LBG52_00875 [Candidatus Peribacteria bacterium]|nr:hypothetical protein [Candidatus Peribacteria bacterium]